MTEYKAVIKDAELAKEILDATARYQDELCASLQRAKQVESADDYKRLRLTVGHVLATLGGSILFPIYRRYPYLTPDSLKDIIAKEAQQSGAVNSRPPGARD